MLKFISVWRSEPVAPVRRIDLIERYGVLLVKFVREMLNMLRLMRGKFGLWRTFTMLRFIGQKFGFYGSISGTFRLFRYISGSSFEWLEYSTWFDM